MFASRIAFVDLETTGASPQSARITEVGIVLVETGPEGERVSEWASLVNPGCRIPPDIQWLTGISDAMVRDAPAFAELAPAIAEQLAGAIFVAHNARFDYGFLRTEFSRAGIDFHARTLCTVRLSRHLYPDRGAHSLAAIIERFGIATDARHRALADARATLAFVRKLYERLPRATVEDAVRLLLKHPSTPPQLPAGAIDALPHAPGVYLMFGANEAPIYIGKSVDLRARVAAHFADDHRRASEQHLAQEVQRIEWEETAGETGALLREAQLIKTRLPAHNRRLRRNADGYFIAIDATGRPQFRAAHEVAPQDLAEHHGPFASRAVARSMLAKLAREEQLCLRTLGLEKRSKGEADDTPCFARQLRRCRGACTGDETLAEHTERLRVAMAAWRLPPWPHAGAIALVERDTRRHAEDWHVFDAWCHLGTVKTLDAALELAAGAPREFESDACRILRAALAAPGSDARELVALHSP